MGKYTVTAGQNLFDVALHIYGSIEGILDLMMNNTSLSLAGALRAGDTLEFSDDYLINPGIVAHYRMNGIVPANGERNVYYRPADFPKVFKIRLNSVQTSAGFGVSGNGQIEIDWEDNSPLEKVMLRDTLQSLSHSFNSAVPKSRNILIYGDFSIKQLDFTDLQALSIFLFRTVTVEKLILKDSQANLIFLPLIKNVYEVNLSGLKTASLLPLLENKDLMKLDLSGINVPHDVLDEYLIASVKKHSGRRSCTVILTEHPSGEYREPGRDENGKYLPACGMEAIWVLCNEPAWNEAGYWKFIINDTVYTTHNS
jgi:hypothetical protein